MLITRSGWSASSARASSRATSVACSRGLRAVQRRVQVDALASAGHRYRIVADVAQDVADQHGDLGALSQAHARTGIKIKNQSVGIAAAGRRAEPPLRHVDLQGGQLGQPGQRGKIIDHWVVVVVIFVGDRVPRHPVRRAGGQILVEEDGRRFAFTVPTPSGQRLRVAGRS